MYVIKHVPEDFVVKEVSTVRLKEDGKFLYFRLWKKDCTTLFALERIARALRVPAKALSCAGYKDRRAVTEQVCSVRGVSREKLERLSFGNIVITVLGRGDEPVHVGGLEGNEFRIMVRNVDKLPEEKPMFRNLFGGQRFGGNNVEVGRALVRRDFEKAAKLIAGQHQRIGEGMGKYLEEKNWVSALRAVPLKLLSLYVHAYQSWLWNKAALKTKKDVLPVVGFGTEELDEGTGEILEEEGVSPSDFVIRELPELSAEGAERQVWVEAKGLAMAVEEDEFFPGKKKVVLSFFLPKGCYATEFVRRLFGQ